MAETQNSTDALFMETSKHDLQARFQLLTVFPVLQYITVQL